MFCLSRGSKLVPSFAILQAAAVRATEQAIVNAVREGVKYDIIADSDDEE